MKIKKIFRQGTLILLTGGASLLIGFLSFTGMLAITPLLPVAFTSFLLSVAYEGEIYFQNIAGTLKKLFKPYFYEQQYARQFMHDYFPKNLFDKKCPLFFRDYAAQLHECDNITLDPNSPDYQEQLKKHAAATKVLNRMEKWFAKQLFHPSTDEKQSPYVSKLQEWLEQQQDEQGISRREQFKQQLAGAQKQFFYARWFSWISGFSMAVGTTYLLMESFAAIPWLASLSVGVLPWVVIPLSIIAGVAYSFQIYNSLTDMITNETLLTWAHKIKQDLQEGRWLMPAAAVILLVFALALTVCTAGTWWTIAKEARPVFNGMKNMPRFVMGVIHPLITGLTSLAFILENTSETLNMFEAGLSMPISDEKTTPKEHTKTKHWLTEINPFRWMIRLTYQPVRYFLFLGHLISIGVTTDRLPGLSSWSSTAIGIASEGGEDLHYFFHPEHQHGHSTEELMKQRLNADHDHQHDFPEQVLNYCYYPLFTLAAGWNYLASRIEHYFDENKAPVDFKTAWRECTGLMAAEEPCCTAPQTPLDNMTLCGATSTAPSLKVSSDWKAQDALFQIDRHIEKNLHSEPGENTTASEHVAKLTSLKQTLLKQTKLKPQKREPVAAIIKKHLEKEVMTYQNNVKNTFFGLEDESGNTHALLEKLAQQPQNPIRAA